MEMVGKEQGARVGARPPCRRWGSAGERRSGKTGWAPPPLREGGGVSGWRTSLPINVPSVGSRIIIKSIFTCVLASLGDVFRKSLRPKESQQRISAESVRECGALFVCTGKGLHRSRGMCDYIGYQWPPGIAEGGGAPAIGVPSMISYFCRVSVSKNWLSPAPRPRAHKGKVKALDSGHRKRK